ncbi:MAG TPA: tetratricopeptide repeat protein [Acidobacteriaceae bacterium]|nr:tetratricopeptide repeat protein [Acidobacteriaceae bacterium]
MQGLSRIRNVLALLLLVAFAGAGWAQEPAEAKPEEPAAVHGRLLLVLPFENKSGVANLDWVGEAFPEVLNRRLNSAGFLTISRGDRLYAFDHLGLPLMLEPSRATAIRIAQTLDADYVVFGHYTLGNNTLQATAEVLDVGALQLNNALHAEGDLTQLLPMINGLAWQVTRQIDPSNGVEESTFVAADGSVPAEAFEHYIQGLTADTSDKQIADLKEAVRLDENFPPARLALGRAYFADQEYDQAATTLGQLPKDNANALEADFYRGLALFYTGNYGEAEDAFAFVSTRLPLPEVVNNQGVAATRRGQDAAALFQQAIAADPKDPDYHFNLGVALEHRGDRAGALREIEETLKLRPGDTEAQGLEKQLEDPANAQANPDPGHAIADAQGSLTRIKRSFSEAGFRQAAFELEQVQQMRLATLPAPERAAELVQDGDQFFQRGLVLEAEREYREALKADGHSAPAHAGLAAVRERDGEPGAARQEAQASIGLEPNVAAYLVLARLDLASKQLEAAAGDVDAALKLDPTNANAKGMKLAVEGRKDSQ